MKEKHYQAWRKTMGVLAFILFLQFGYVNVIDYNSNAVLGWMSMLLFVLYLHTGQRNRHQQEKDKEDET